MRTTFVTRDVVEAILKAGFSWRPYVLRVYCDTNMIIAEFKGKISHPYLQFIMGMMAILRRDTAPTKVYCRQTWLRIVLDV
ncbi:MAG: hypothetical protein N3E48_01755 [Candidatus Bathyarchaeota archaeon]|nr:hypothetical protein [Candidatus Bathyarchaeota archaeon]